MDKPALRKSLLAKRNALSPDAWRARSKSVQERLVIDPAFARARTVALYRELHSEVQTGLLHDAALEQKKRTAYPEVVGPERPMRFIFADALTPWLTSQLGFEVPVSTDTCALESIDLFVVPGLAFDCAGRRLGRGAGHYDRTLAHAPGMRIGLALDFQLLDELPEDPWDVRMDLIVTEREIIRASARAAR